MAKAKFRVEPAAIRRAVVVALAGFLISYHGYSLYGLSRGPAPSLADSVQAPLKALIVVGLVLVIANRRVGLWPMWFGILALIGSQYWVYFGFQAAEFTVERSPFSYLRGLMIPAIITVLFHSR